MSGLLTSFGVGVSGINTAHNGLNATAHNIANTDTKGYVRQQVLIVDQTYEKTPTVRRMDQTGHGSIVDKIRQLRDRFLDASYRNEVGRQGFYQSQSDTMKEIEGLFGELEGTTFQSAMENLWKAVQELQKEPDSIVARTSLVETANVFIERCESITGQIRNFRENVNLKIENTVKRINEIGDRINKLNKLIRDKELGNQKANDFRDERNKLLDELGGYVKISYKETQNYEIIVNVEGTQFVTEFDVNHMGLLDTDDKLKLHTPVWPFDVGEKGIPREVFNLSVPPTAKANTDIGSLKGLLLARGKEGRYTDIPVRPELSDYKGEDDPYYINAIEAFEEATTKFNNGVRASVITNVEAHFDQLIHGVTTMINNVLLPNLTATWSDDGDVVWRNQDGKILEGDEVPDIDISDLDAYKTEERDAMGRLTGRYKVSILDRKNAPVSSDKTKVSGNALFERKSVKCYKELEDVEMDGKKVWLYNREAYDVNDEQSKYSLFSVGEIKVNEAVRDNVSLLPLNYNTNTGDYSMDIAAKLNKIWNDKFAVLNPNTLTKNTFTEYYTAYISDIANTGSTLDALTKSQEITTRSVDDQRQQVLGVSSDEELTHLIKFQQAFNAASRYITVIDDMLEHLILRLA